MGWKDPLSWARRRADENLSEYEKRLARTIAQLDATRGAPPQYKDPGGLDGDHLRGAFDRAADEPALYADGDLVLLTANVAVVVAELTHEKRYDELHVLNVIGDAPSPGNQNLLVSVNAGPFIPTFSGDTLSLKGVSRVEFRSNNPGTGLQVFYRLARSASFRPPPLLMGQRANLVPDPTDGNLEPLRVRPDSLSVYRLLVDPSGVTLTTAISSIESGIPAAAVEWSAFITGLGGALGNVVFVPPVGAIVFITDLSLVALTPATSTRAEYYYASVPPPGGLRWHHCCKTGDGSQQHAFGANPPEANPGDTVMVDIYQTGVASPWWVTARGYYLV